MAHYTSYCALLHLRSLFYAARQALEKLFLFVPRGAVQPVRRGRYNFFARYRRNATGGFRRDGALLEQLEALPVELGEPQHLVADTGYFSETNVNACGEQKITPLIAVKREGHHPDPMARFAGPPPLKEDATELEKMRHLLLTMAG